MSIEARQIQKTLYLYAAILNFTPSPQGLRAKFAHAPYKMPSSVLPDREQSSQICELFTLYMNFFWTLKICELFVNFLKYHEQFHELWYFHFFKMKMFNDSTKKPVICLEICLADLQWL